MTLGSIVSTARRRASGGAIRVAAAELPSRRVFQRTGGTAVLSLSGTYTGTTTGVSARIINAETSTEVLGWTAVASGASGPTVVASWLFAEASGNRASSVSSLDILVPSASAPTKVAGPSGKDAVNFVKASTQQFSLAETDMSAGFPGKSTVTNDSVTVGAWVRVDSETGGDGSILSKATNYQLLIEGSAVQFRIHSSTDTVVFSTDAQTYVSGAWKHYVGRYTQSTGEVALFANGVKQTPVTIATRKVGTGDFLLAASPFKPNLDGALAEVFVCASALTDSEISNIYTNGLGSSGNGVWNGTLTVPQGGWYKLQYRLDEDPAAVYTAANTVAVGDVWMLAGQSQQNRMSILVNAPPTPDDRTAYYTGAADWTLPGVVAGTGGNGVVRFLNLMVSYTTVPQAVVQVSVDDTAITDWEAGDPAYLTAVTRLTSLGAVSGILWNQGGTGIGTITKADYKTRLAALRTGLSGAATVQRFGVFPLMNRSNTADSDFFTQETRRAHYEYLAENSTVVNLGWVPDVPLSDDINQTASGSELIAYAYAHALLFAMGTETVHNLGPSITGASRTGTTITLTVQHRAGSALKTNTGSPATGFQVFPRDAVHSDAAALPISSVTLGTNTISLVLATDPAGPVDVYYQWGRFDGSSPVYDNTAALGRTVGNALQPLMSPVQTALEAGVISNPALALDNATGHIRYALTGGWNLPDADWTMGIWARIDNPAGTASQYLISCGPYGGVQTFNLLIYEAGVTGATAKPGAVEMVIRGAGATALTISGAANASFLDTSWRLFIVERVKATEVINIYHVSPGGTRTLYISGSVTGLGAVAPTTPVAFGTRAPPVGGNDRWLAGSLYSSFRMNGLLTATEMQQIASGSDLVTDLSKTPDIYTKLNTLTTPIANSGSASNGAASVIGGVTLTSGPQFPVLTNAVQFDETGLIYTMTKTASHTLPAGEWTLGFIMAFDDNVGTVAQYIYSTGAFFAAGCVNFFLGEASYAGTAANRFSFSFDDGAASLDQEIFTPTVTSLVDGKYYLWTIERDASSGSIKIYYTPINGTRVLFHDAILSGALGALQPPGTTITIGTRQDTPATRYFGGKMHLAFQMDGRLTQAQMQDIARGKDLKTSLGINPKWYHKFTSTAATLTDLSGNGNTATQSGGTATLVSGPTFMPNG